mgnify:CR=1 FL=1
MTALKRPLSAILAFIFGGNEIAEDIHLLNVIIYIPIGLYLKLITKLSDKKIILIIILSSLIFEIEQSITCIGGLDGTDLVTNFIGGLIGLYSFKIISKFKIKYINLYN